MASSVHSSVVIARPIEGVFAVLTNVENTGKWFSGDVQEWWTSPPPLGVGSTRRARVKMGLMTTENDAAATVDESPNRAVLKGTSKNAPIEAELTFTTVEAGRRSTPTSSYSCVGRPSCSGRCSCARTARAGIRASST
ncbi:MAG: SRPBCC family protein [Chloroflexi bacterium]|nr:SRPBCC family protein [Chloroflexota bacterium]